MIDFTSGAISFDDGLQLCSGDSVEKVASLPGVREMRSVPGRRQFTLGSHFDGEVKWGVGAICTGSKLNQVWLQCLSCVESSDFSLANERVRKRVHDETVEKARQHGALLSIASPMCDADFPWGGISSVLDLRGVQALLIVVYS